MKSPSHLIRKHVRSLHAYTPGEQPKRRRLLKLNTNENPWGPAPAVLEAIRQCTDQRLRLYPDPSASELREKLARHHGVNAENIIIGNGSDDILALSFRAFVEPKSSSIVQKYPYKGTVQYFAPSYSLYPVLAESYLAHILECPLENDHGLPEVKTLKESRNWDFKSALSFVTTPNAPTGRGYTTAELEKLCKVSRGVVVLDEAYADFARENAMELASKYPHVIVSRTFSKSYSLCFQRIGYAVGHPELIGALHKVRDSYNVNGLGQVAAIETLNNLDYYRDNFNEILVQRDRVSQKLAAAGFDVLPSQTNFILASPPGGKAEWWFSSLRDMGIIVRYFNSPGLDQFLRITIGSPTEMSRFLRAVTKLLKLA